MADKTIKAFDAVTSPAATDILLTQQAADDINRKITAQQIVEAFAHAARHISGGADAFTSTQLLEAIVKRIQESGGPTTLAVGAIADNALFRRSGTTCVGRAEADVETTKLKESGGPTVLTAGAIADGKLFKRSGSTIIGANPKGVLVFTASSRNQGTTAYFITDLDLNSTEASAGRIVVPAMTVTAIRALQLTAVGGSAQTVNYQLRDDAADAAGVLATINTGSSKDSTTGLSVSVAVGSEIAIQVVTSATSGSTGNIIVLIEFDLV